MLLRFNFGNEQEILAADAVKENLLDRIYWESYQSNSNLILGDAAHAIVPFYGQGMNAAFEDVFEFDTALEAHHDNWEAAFLSFQQKRKKDTDGIADLAIDNFHEMKDHVANPVFQQKRTLEMALETALPNTYFSKYSMVTFREDMGYNQAMLVGRAQDKVILNMIENEAIDLNLPIESIYETIKKETYLILEGEQDTID